MFWRKTEMNPPVFKYEKIKHPDIFSTEKEEQGLYFIWGLYKDDVGMMEQLFKSVLIGGNSPNMSASYFELTIL